MSPVRPRGPRRASRSRASRVLAVAFVVAAVALSGCSGLPSFKLPDGSQGDGGGAVNGQAGQDLGDGQALPGQEPSALPEAPAPDPAPATETLPVTQDAVEALPTDVVPVELGWLVQFPAGTRPQDMESRLEEKGGQFMFAFKSLPIAYMLASEGQAKEIGRDQSLVVEPELALEFHDAESRPAIRLPDVIHPVTGLKDAAGNPIDGRGVGVAVVDTGIDALHADLPYAPLVAGGVVVANYKVVSQQYIALADTDTSAGHGTHVAAIVAGQGTGDVTVRGVAPAAKLYGLGIGEASTTVWAAQAFDWILQNHASVNPPIRVVTNSWGTTGTYSATSTTTLFVNALVDHGLVVVFSAGNGGGDGSTAKTSPECQIPRPGVICVAGYDDLGTGTRNGNIGTYSSRGATAQPATWPDVSAPGTNVLSARPPAGSITGFGTNVGYVQLSGTSQATPHVTGIVALMLQKNPNAAPWQVEAKLKVSAYEFANGGAYAASGSHFAKGHGLADAYAAVAGF